MASCYRVAIFKPTLRQSQRLEGSTCVYAAGRSHTLQYQDPRHLAAHRYGQKSLKQALC